MRQLFILNSHQYFSLPKSESQSLDPAEVRRKEGKQNENNYCKNFNWFLIKENFSSLSPILYLRLFLHVSLFFSFPFLSLPINFSNKISVYDTSNIFPSVSLSLTFFYSLPRFFLVFVLLCYDAPSPSYHPLTIDFLPFLIRLKVSPLSTITMRYI